jgi:hypothetical protein
VIQYRRLAALLLGMWLGGGIFADFAVIQNFDTVDRFLLEPGSILSAAELVKIGRDRERVLLRRNAGEENTFLFQNWERAELLLGTLLLLVLAFGSRPEKLSLSLTLAMMAIVAVQHFYFTPVVADLGRQIADLPPKHPLNDRFWMLHGISSGAEICKLLIGAGLALRLSFKPAVKQPSVKQNG